VRRFDDTCVSRDQYFMKRDPQKRPIFHEKRPTKETNIMKRDPQKRRTYINIYTCTNMVRVGAEGRQKRPDMFNSDLYIKKRGFI